MITNLQQQINMNRQTFITENYFRTLSDLSQNIEYIDLAPHVFKAQRRYLRKILGSTFYDYLLNAYSGQTLNSVEITLVEYMQPVLAYRAAQLALPFVHYQVKNKGIQAQFGDNSTYADQTALNYLKNEIENSAEDYTGELISYLNINQNLYPLFLSQQSSDEVVFPQPTRPYNAKIALYDVGCNDCISRAIGLNRIY